eukprot:366161-Chlamydomonas_euryale.AAC.2
MHAHVRTEHACTQCVHEGSRAFTLMCNRGGVVRAQNIRQGRRTRPITPRPRPSRGRGHARKCPVAGGLGAFTCMHVRGRGPAEAEAGVIGQHRRLRQACFVQE